MTKYINPSWERERDGDLHSPKGIAKLRSDIRFGLRKKYIGIAESMWRYEAPTSSARFEDMRVMSQDTAPEYYLMKNGQCVWFTIGDQVHCLPMTYVGGINMYGKPSSWHAVPVGYDPKRPDLLPELFTRVMTYEDSVVMRNDLFGGNDEAYIEAMIDELVDNTLTMNQLQLIAKTPFIFNVSEENLQSAKNVFLAISNDSPAIYVNRNGEDPTPVMEATNMSIDPALFELFDRFECQILEYIGFPCVPITKRAQQSVSEVQSNDAKIYARRQEKYNQRKKACERINELFGTDLTVVSVIDELSGLNAEGVIDDDSGDEGAHGSDDAVAPNGGESDE